MTSRVAHGLGSQRWTAPDSFVNFAPSLFFRNVKTGRFRLKWCHHSPAQSGTSALPRCTLLIVDRWLGVISQPSILG